MKFDNTKPVDTVNDDDAPLDEEELDEEEIEQLNTQLDELNSVLDNLETRNDKIKEKLVTLLNSVKEDREHINMTENLLNEMNLSAKDAPVLIELKNNLASMESKLGVFIPMVQEANKRVMEANEAVNEAARAKDEYVQKHTNNKNIPSASTSKNDE